MTPDQFEQIKRDYQKCKSTTGEYTTIPMEWYGLLLDALEDALEEIDSLNAWREYKSEMSQQNP
ncbi:hypothetical protein A3842_11105 [Paenibacillus sp. P3E]|uniref:hypothetical protein n=1 Tax=Paenibacillus sp. P3E TaxID=1349435 RepID=UPI00093AEB4E|nr:hypothetical protein [Paenibacillus sp. P3E]OKP81619.1 hypothetical protein A3842_11105 [Paenibacillus sp. P3E]